MWTHAILPLFFASATVANASAELLRTPVSVNLVGDDGLTQKLSVGIETALKHDPDLRPAVAGDRNIVSITSDGNVDWDKLDGRTVVIYTVHVFHGSESGEPSVGICYESGIKKCVSDILRLARIDAKGL